MIRYEFSIRVSKDTDEEFKVKELARHAAKFMKGLIEIYPHLIERKDIETLPEDEVLIFPVFFDIEKLQPDIQTKKPSST
jgi:hypothetical protein